MGVIYINGQSCEDYGVWVEHPPKYSYPKKDIDTVHVPGRNGDIIFDKGTYQNVTGSYDLAIAARNYGESYQSVCERLVEWLHSFEGYTRIEDTYNPYIYRYGYYDENGDIDNINNLGGRITINFICKPQKFMKIGDIPVNVLMSNTVIFNPTKYESLPIIKVNCNGNGVMSINGQTIQVKNVNEYVYINSEVMDCYKETVNMNSNIEFDNSEFPKLKSGQNIISFSGNITSIEIIPRWWQI